MDIYDKLQNILGRICEMFLRHNNKVDLLILMNTKVHVISFVSKKSINSPYIVVGSTWASKLNILYPQTGGDSMLQGTAYSEGGALYSLDLINVGCGRRLLVREAQGCTWWSCPAWSGSQIGCGGQEPRGIQWFEANSIYWLGGHWRSGWVCYGADHAWDGWCD